MAAGLRFALMLVVGVVLCGGMTSIYSAAVDSAYAPPSGQSVKPKPTGSYIGGRAVISPFILGRGYTNVTNQTGNSCTAPTISGFVVIGGQYWYEKPASRPGCEWYASGLFYCQGGYCTYWWDCKATVHPKPALCNIDVFSESGMADRSGNVCPIGFVAKVLVKPQNSVPGAQPVACVTTEPSVYDTTTRTIKFTVAVGAFPKASNMTYWPGTSFNWEIHCYPNINAQTANDVFPQTAKTPSSLGDCENNSATALPILLWDQGFIFTLTNSGGSFLTNRRCPAGYTRNVVISGPGIFNHNFSDNGTRAIAHVPTGGGVCITGVTEPSTNPDKYSVAYLYNSHSVKLDMDATANSISVELPISTSDALQNFGWKLYCYPPGYNGGIPADLGGSCYRTTFGETPFRAP